jgi:hypothetical protein
MKRDRAIWITPSGVLAPPSGGSGWLVMCEVKKTLSSLTPALSSDGGSPASARRKHDSTRVSLRNSPSSSPTMLPKPSATTKLSPSFSTNSRIGPRGEPASPSDSAPATAGANG